MDIRKNLVKYRKLAGYDNARCFAKACGIEYTTYMAYENKGSEPKYEALCKIAEELGVTPNDLLGFKGKGETAETVKEIEERFSEVVLEQIKELNEYYPLKEVSPAYLAEVRMNVEAVRRG